MSKQFNSIIRIIILSQLNISLLNTIEKSYAYSHAY